MRKRKRFVEEIAGGEDGGVEKQPEADGEDASEAEKGKENKIDALIDDSRGYQPIKLPYKAALREPKVERIEPSDKASSNRVKSVIKLKETEIVTEGDGGASECQKIVDKIKEARQKPILL